MFIDKKLKKELIREVMKKRLASINENRDPYSLSEIGSPDLPDYTKNIFDRNLTLLKNMSDSINDVCEYLEGQMREATEDWNHPLAIIDRDGLTPRAFIQTLSTLKILRSTVRGLNNLAEAIVRNGYSTEVPPVNPKSSGENKGENGVEKEEVFINLIDALKNVDVLLDKFTKI